MPDVSQTLAYVVATVFATAAVSKLLTYQRTISDLLVIVLELALAVLLLSRWEVFPVALISLIVCLAYALYAWTRYRGEQCQCFGDRLPATPRGGQRFRNTALLLCVLGYTAIISHTQGTAIAVIADALVGVVVGASLVAGPWLWAWSTGTASPKPNPG